MNSIELQFTYSELFSDAIPKIEDELAKLNMHKSVSIICELIRAIGGSSTLKRTEKIRGMIE